MLLILFVVLALILISLGRRKREPEWTTIPCEKCGNRFVIYPYPEDYLCPRCKPKVNA
jgi:hypothetical protein